MSADIPTVIVARGTIVQAERTNGIGAWSQCARCRRGVLLPEDAIAKVTAGIWRALCVTCAMQIAEEHPEAFAPEKLIGHIGDES